MHERPRWDVLAEALPWATWLIGALILAAAAVLLTGLIVAIRDLRRPAPAAGGAAARAGSRRRLHTGGAPDGESSVAA